MNKFRLELKVENLCRQMLSACIMQRHTSIFTACDEKVAVGRVGDRANWLIELSEVVTYASFLDIKDSHRARLEAAGKNGQRGMSRHAQRLIDRAGEFDNLVECV